MFALRKIEHEQQNRWVRFDTLSGDRIIEEIDRRSVVPL